MSALVLVGLNIFDAWLLRIYLGLEAVELNPLAQPFMANIVARALMVAAIILTLYLLRKDNLLWGANVLTLGVVSWHLTVHTIEPFMNAITMYNPWNVC